MPLGLTLIEAQKYARRAEQLAVLKTFAEGELLRRLPFRNLVGGSLSFPAETKLPRVGFRAVNEGYRQSYGVINSDSEFVHLFGGDLDVDRSIVDLQGPEARAAQTEMKVRSMRLTLEAAIINGDDTFDPRAFNGLSKRLVPGEDQTIDNGGSTLNLLALVAALWGVYRHLLSLLGGEPAQVAARVAALLVPGLRRVINATGVVLHTNLGRAQMAEAAISAMVFCEIHPYARDGR